MNAVAAQSVEAANPNVRGITGESTKSGAPGTGGVSDTVRWLAAVLDELHEELDCRYVSRTGTSKDVDPDSSGAERWLRRSALRKAECSALLRIEAWNQSAQTELAAQRAEIERLTDHCHALDTELESLKKLAARSQCNTQPRGSRTMGAFLVVALVMLTIAWPVSTRIGNHIMAAYVICVSVVILSVFALSARARKAE